MQRVVTMFIERVGQQAVATAQETLKQLPPAADAVSIALGLVGTAAQAVQALLPVVTRTVVVSRSRTRTDGVPLSYATVVGDAYIYLSDPLGGATRVRWWFDDPYQEDPEATATSTPPFDLVGTGIDGLALPLDTRTLREGTHFIVAEVDSASGTSRHVVRFQIDNRSYAQEQQTYRAAAAHWPLKWPVTGTVTSAYGQRWGRTHRGVDVGAPTGTPVHAAYGGTVRFAGSQTGYGNTVEIQHVNGYWTLYAHLDRIFVSEGQALPQGEVIGAVGSTGHSSGPHLHFEVRDANNAALDTNSAYRVDDQVTAKTPFRFSMNMPATDTTGNEVSSGFVDMTSRTDGGGYWLLHSDGLVTGHGSAAVYGHRRAENDATMVGIARHPNDSGYWLAATDGGVFTFGVNFHGAMQGQALNRPIVGIAPTPSGNGYWLVASDGGIFALGDAGYHGSTGGMQLNKPIVGMAATPSGGGYWLVAEDGGIFNFGDAGFHGSAGGSPVNAAAVSVSRTRSGNGYWLGFADGGVFTYGDAPFAGSAAEAPVNSPVTDIETTAASGYNGYWLQASDGGVFSYDAPFFGSSV